MLSKLGWEFQRSLSETVLLVPYLGIFLLFSGTGPASVVYFEFRQLWLRATVSHRYALKMLQFRFSSSQDLWTLLHILQSLAERCPWHRSAGC